MPECTNSKIDKSNDLHSFLDSAAATAIQGLALNKMNYDAAVEVLKEKPQNIITAYMDKLLKLHHVQVKELLPWDKYTTIPTFLKSLIM